MDHEQPLIEVSGLIKKFPNFTLGPIDCSLMPGEVLGLIGPNGAGKSTLLKLLMGFMQADAGTITMLGKSNIHTEPSIKQHIAYFSEDMRLYSGKTLLWHMQFFAKGFTEWDPVFAKQLAQRFELDIKQDCAHFSLGQRIKALLVLALARKPKVLIFDEPSTGLDPVARFELTATLFDVLLGDEVGLIFSSQYTQDVERLADRIAFIDQGRLISLEEKDTYLEKWRSLTLASAPTAPLPDGMYTMMHGFSKQVIVDTQYTPQREKLLTTQGLGVVHSQPLSLEEIFIQQTLITRSEKGVPNGY